MSEELHMRLKIQAAREKRTMQELIIQAIEEYLKKKGGWAWKQL